MPSTAIPRQIPVVFPRRNGLHTLALRRLLRCLSLGAGGWVFAAWAQPVPRLDGLALNWFQRGTTNDVTLTGENLPTGATLHFAGTGITGTLEVLTTTNVALVTSGTGLSATPATVGQKSARARFLIAPDAPLGAQEWRLIGSTGVSNGQQLQISDLPEIREQATHDSAENAQRLPLPQGVSGVIAKPAEADFFKFHARAGERLILDVQANRVGSPLDALMLLYDASGKELARNEDSHGLDPFLEFTAPSEGDYVIKLHDLRFQGGDAYRYRLVVGALPYLERLFPFGGKRGSTVDLRLEGSHLEGADRMSLRVAADAATGRQEVRTRTARGSSNPQFFEVSDLPDALEVEPNNEKPQAHNLTTPVAVNGRINAPKDLDFFRFKSERDQRLTLEVHARRFGSPLDALLTLMDATGNVLQRNDDAAGGVDARLDADFKAGQEYLVSVADLTDRGGPAFGYRLTVQPPDTAPDFSVSAGNGRVRVHAGGHTAVRVEVSRRNGLDGIVVVTAESLPLGLSASPVVLDPRGASFGWLILSADAQARPITVPLRLVATTEQAGRSLKRTVTLPETGFLTVLPSAPFGLAVAESSLAIEQAGSAHVETSIVRRDGFTGEVKIIAEDFAGVGQPSLSLPGTQFRGRLTLNAAYNSPPGVRPLMLRAEASVDGATVVEYAPAPIWVTTRDIPLFVTAMLPGSSFFRTDVVRLSAIALPTGSKSEANQTEFVVKVDRRGFVGEIPLSLEGLPAGVSAQHGTIASNLNEASIKLLIGDQTEVGKEHSFSVLASVTNSDRIFRQRTQPVKLTAQAPEKEVAASSTNNAAAPAK